MSRNIVRIVVALGAVSIIVIIFSQLFWLQQVTRITKAQQAYRIEAALNVIANDMKEFAEEGGIIIDPVKQINDDHFIVELDQPFESKIMGNYLQTEFMVSRVETDFNFGVYDCMEGVLDTGVYLAYDSIYRPVVLDHDHTVPVWDSTKTHLSILFPHMTRQTADVRIWIISLILLVVLMVFFGTALFVVLQHRKQSELTKDFISNMAHEFKTPIATIAIASNVLSKPNILQRPEKLNTYAGLVGKEASRLQNLLEKALQVIRIQKSELQLKQEPIEMHETLHQVLQSVNISLDQKGGSVTENFLANDDNIIGDKVHIANIFYNLLDNAIKYCKESPKIELATRSEEAGIWVSVKDNGIGMSKDALKRIFDKFYRVPTGNLHDVKGFGLGLSYVQMMVSAHKGKIEVESKKDKGTIFNIYLPKK